VAHGKSAYKAGKLDAAWQEVVDDIKHRRIQVVVMWKVDRFDRQNLLHAIPMANMVLDAGGRIEFSTQRRIDLSDSYGRKEFANRIEDAYEESKIKSDRIRISKDTIRRNKAFDGRPPYGYQTVGEKYNKQLVHDPITSAIVRKMVEWCLDGDTLAGIAKRLDDLSIPVPNKRKPSVNGWAPKTVKDILTSETLIGKRHGAKGKIINTFDPPIELDTWHKLQTLIKMNERKRGSVVKAPGTLSDISFCGTCGRIMHYRSIPDKKNPAYVWTGYRCDGTSKDPSKCKNMVSAAPVYEAADEAVMAIGHWPNVVTEWKAALDVTAELDRIEAELRGLDYDELDWRETQDRLIAERDELKQSEVKAGELRLYLDGRTVADVYRADKRAWLLEHGWTFTVQATGRGQRPAVMVHGRESLTETIAKATGLTADQVMAVQWIPILAALQERGLPTDQAEIRRIAQQAASK